MAEKHQEKGRKRSLSPSADTKTRKRVKLSSSDIKEFKRDKLIAYWKEQDSYIDSILTKLENSSADEVIRLKECEAKLQLQVHELTRRENVLNMRLATKQEEMRNLLAQLQDLKESQTTESSNLHSMLVDPAVNMVFQRMRSELKDSREKLEQAQNDLSAWKFTPDSVTGKKLMSKCRSLLQENQELGKQISQGRVVELEAEISLYKKHCEELKNFNEELSEYVIQQDEEGEGMLATICDLKQQLSETKEVLSKLEIEKSSSGSTIKSNGPIITSPTGSKLGTIRSQE